MSTQELNLDGMLQEEEELAFNTDDIHTEVKLPTDKPKVTAADRKKAQTRITQLMQFNVENGFTEAEVKNAQTRIMELKTRYGTPERSCCEPAKQASRGNNFKVACRGCGRVYRNQMIVDRLNQTRFPQKPAQRTELNNTRVVNLPPEFFRDHRPNGRTRVVYFDPSQMQPRTYSKPRVYKPRRTKLRSFLVYAAATVIGAVASCAFLYWFAYSM